MVELSHEEIAKAVEAALKEDIGTGDVTSIATIPEKSTTSCKMVTRESLVVSGLKIVEEVFRQVDSTVSLEILVSDGDAINPGATILKAHGSTRSILTAERTALNFLQRLSGIATLTGRFVEAIQGTQAKILDTRKTTPGWRRLEKFAVACGGGENHREGLFDMILIKDNHLAALANEKPNAIAAAVNRARQQFPNLKVEVEADTLEQVEQAADAGADMILLDNMTNEELREAVSIVGGHTLTEASGGVNLETVRTIAETGVDRISVGAITHSAQAVDIGLDFESPI